jgi:hypothetical protein
MSDTAPVNLAAGYTSSLQFPVDQLCKPWHNCHAQLLLPDSHSYSKRVRHGGTIFEVRVKKVFGIEHRAGVIPAIWRPIQHPFRRPAGNFMQRLRMPVAIKL